MYKTIINPDEDHVNLVRQKLKENEGYCPCAITKDEDTKCPCKDFRINIEEGECHCGLFIKERV